ncbi:hypothetical protein DM02DRAFT_617978, partial [Periconia macrospinosa]
MMLLFSTVELSSRLSIPTFYHALLRTAADHCSIAWFNELLLRCAPLGEKKLRRTMRTRNLEAFEILRAVKSKLERDDHSQWTTGHTFETLRWTAKFGTWEKMEFLFHLHDAGFPPYDHQAKSWQKSWQYHSPVLVQAAILHGSEDIMNMLMSQELVDHEPARVDHVALAARHGRWKMVWAMHARGAPLDGGRPAPLLSAVLAEREDMVCKLIEHGVNVKGKVGTHALKRAENVGLDIIKEARCAKAITPRKF